MKTTTSVGFAWRDTFRKNNKKNGASDFNHLAPNIFIIQLVDRPERQSNTTYLEDFIRFYVAPKRIDSSVLKRKYLESNLSAQQLADELGVSKQMILGRLRAAGVHGGKGRGRAPENFRFPNPPFGYRVKFGRLEMNPGEVKIVRLIVELRDRREWTFSAIAKELNQRNLSTRRGCLWTRIGVRSVHTRWKGKL